MTLNLLPIAMAVTGILGCNQTFEYYEYSGATINNIGIEVPTQTTPVTYTGSIQAVDNKLYSQLNLDLAKNYKTVYCPELLKSIAETPITGRIKYNGKFYDIISNQNWWETNGYTQCVICEVKATDGEFYVSKNKE